MEARASAKHVRVTPSKTRQVIDLVRGKDVEEALRLLLFARRPVAKTVAKILKSAVANAAGQEGRVEAEDLYIKTAIVGEGPTMKRFLPRAQGRATPLLKRSCHITIVVADREGARKGGGATRAASAAKGTVKARTGEKPAPGKSARRAKDETESAAGEKKRGAKTAKGA